MHVPVTVNIDILKKLCEMNQVQLVDGAVCKDHVHMYVAIPPHGGACQCALQGFII